MSELSFNGKLTALGEAHGEFLTKLDSLCKESRNKVQSEIRLDECIMWANQAIMYDHVQEQQTKVEEEKKDGGVLN